MDNISKKLEALNQVCDMIEDIYYQYANSFGITDTELNILYALSEHDGEYLQSDICREWHCSLQTIHTTVKNMEKKGMIELLCQEGNKKNKYIHLTIMGKKLLDNIITPLVKAEEEAFRMLTVQEQDIFLPLLQKYADALDTTIGGIAGKKD
ncbi:MarR family winged helix-turn-helix transcriptional regulator [Blautia sp. XA-2221]|uniref:MarR family winged helix-turn-helix transcriptional regulator n=1 Tax=Blautia sp. XA-2221 TaxID=2903961 RepID=UPI00237A00B7|nr:MarR family transcriptional regulator [Blautia sp. XA-2221]